MKKIMIAACAVALASVAQAVAFNWSTTSKLYGVTAASVGDNGVYAAATSGTTDRGDKVLSNLAYTLLVYDTENNLVGQTSGTVTWGSLGKVSTSIAVDGTAADKTYNWVLQLSGNQTDLSGRGAEAAYDYSAATVSAELSGSVTTPTMGGASLGNVVPTEWTVSGIVPAPEPTSALLLLLGVAGLALRRRQA